MDGDLVTFVYDVRRIRNSDSPFYWVLALHQMVDLAEDKTIWDFVVAATRGNSPISLRPQGNDARAPLGLDPRTQLDGFRFDGGPEPDTRYTITFDAGVLQEGCVLDAGSVLAATQVGDQDIRKEEGLCPGYLCVIGPVCACVPAVQTCETAFAFARGRARQFVEFPLSGSDRGAWGWTNGPFDNGIYELEMRAAAGPCGSGQQVVVGMLYVFYHSSIATIVYEMDSNYTMEEVRLYVGSEPLPRDAQGRITSDPGGFPYTADALGGVADHIFVAYDLSGPIYVVAHAIVCWQG